MTSDRNSSSSDADRIFTEDGELLDPASPEELQEAETLRAALEPDGSGEDASLHDVADLACALRTASAPGSLSADVNDALLSRAFGGSIEAEPDAAEREQAGLLADELQQLLSDPSTNAEGGSDLAQLSLALRSAADPKPLDEFTHERILRRALRAFAPRRLGVSKTVGALVLAASAAAAGWFGLAAPSQGVVETSSLGASLINSRSTLEHFDASEPFPTTGGTSDRVDKISRIRSGELRKNRFAAWGVE